MTLLTSFGVASAHCSYYLFSETQPQYLHGKHFWTDA